MVQGSRYSFYAQFYILKYFLLHDAWMTGKCLKFRTYRLKECMSDSVTNYNYVGDTKISISIKKTNANKCTLSEIFLPEKSVCTKTVGTTLDILSDVNLCYAGHYQATQDIFRTCFGTLLYIYIYILYEGFSIYNEIVLKTFTFYKVQRHKNYKY